LTRKKLRFLAISIVFENLLKILGENVEFLCKICYPYTSFEFKY